MRFLSGAFHFYRQVYSQQKGKNNSKRIPINTKSFRACTFEFLQYLPRHVVTMTFILLYFIITFAAIFIFILLSNNIRNIHKIYVHRVCLVFHNMTLVEREFEIRIWRTKTTLINKVKIGETITMYYSKLTKIHLTLIHPTSSWWCTYMLYKRRRELMPIRSSHYSFS